MEESNDPYGYLQLPPELRSCPASALTAFKNASILQFNSQPEFAKRLNVDPAIVHQSTLELLARSRSAGEGGDPLRVRASPSPSPTPTPAAVDPQQPPSTHYVHTTNQNECMLPQEYEQPALSLVLCHDCLHIGCTDPSCQLCLQAQARRCDRNFCPKYLVGDPLRAACGAAIRVQVIDTVSGRKATAAATADMALEVVVINGKALEALAGLSLSDRDLEEFILLANRHGAPLLVQGIAFSHNNVVDPSLLATSSSTGVRLPIRNSEAILSDLRITGSSEAILQGQRPQFAFLIRVRKHGSDSGSLPRLVSEGFVVATPRVRTAAKKVIPHVRDHVSKLAGVGKATQAKLADLRKAAVEAGSPGLSLPMGAVETVGEFKSLVEWASQDNARLMTMKKVLKLTKGWEEARDHAAMAVRDDSLLRAWYLPKSLQPSLPMSRKWVSLVYACSQGVPHLESPVALMEMTEHGDCWLAAVGPTRSVAGGQRPPLTPPTPILEAAKIAFCRPHHPGWSMLPVSTEVFLEQTRSRDGLLVAREMLAECQPPTVPYTDEYQRTEPTRVVTGIQHPNDGDSLIPVSMKLTTVRQPHVLQSRWDGENQNLQQPGQQSGQHQRLEGFPSVPPPAALSRLLSSFPPLASMLNSLGPDCRDGIKYSDGVPSTEVDPELFLPPSCMGLMPAPLPSQPSSISHIPLDSVIANALDQDQVNSFNLPSLSSLLPSLAANADLLTGAMSRSDGLAACGSLLAAQALPSFNASLYSEDALLRSPTFRRGGESRAWGRLASSLTASEWHTLLHGTAAPAPSSERPAVLSPNPSQSAKEMLQKAENVVSPTWPAAVTLDSRDIPETKHTEVDEGPEPPLADLAEASQDEDGDAVQQQKRLKTDQSLDGGV
jgi:hypothetical protein